MMALIIIILIVFAFAWAKQNLEIMGMCKGLNEEQKKVVKYLFGGWLVFGKLTDSQYDELIKRKVENLGLKMKAFNKIGLDEDQVNEIAPVNFQGFDFSEKMLKSKLGKIFIGKDDVLRSSQYEVVWLFFSDTQTYMYSYHFDLCSNAVKENTQEYFYKDITNFSTENESIEVPIKKGRKEKIISRTYDRFGLIVPGAQFYCSITNSDNIDESISAMKQKLREKKNA